MGASKNRSNLSAASQQEHMPYSAASRVPVESENLPQYSQQQYPLPPLLYRAQQPQSPQEALDFVGKLGRERTRLRTKEDKEMFYSKVILPLLGKASDKKLSNDGGQQ